MRNNIRNRWSADGSGTRAHPPSRGGERLPLRSLPTLIFSFVFLTPPLCKTGRFVWVLRLLFLKIGALLPVLKPYLCQFEETRCCAASEAFRNDLRMKWHLLLLLSASTCFRGLGCVLLGLFMLWSRNSLWCLVCKYSSMRKSSSQKRLLSHKCNFLSSTARLVTGLLQRH